MNIDHSNDLRPQPCGCHQGPWWGVTPPPQCEYHRQQAQPYTTKEYIEFVTGKSTTPPGPQRLAPADIEAIAQRVAELLKPKRKPRKK